MIVQLHPMTRPTSASRYDHPATFYNSADCYPNQTSSCISTTRPTPAIDITHLAEDPNTTATDFTHTLVIPTINRHFCCICHFAFVSFIVFDCHYSHTLNLNYLLGRRAYRLRNKPRVLLPAGFSVYNRPRVTLQQQRGGGENAYIATAEAIFIYLFYFIYLLILFNLIHLFSLAWFLAPNRREIIFSSVCQWPNIDI